MTDPAERERSPRRCASSVPPAPDPAEAALRLCWLAPSLASLATLARPLTPDTWPALCRDPGAVLLLLRQPAAHSPPSPALPFPAALLTGPAPCEMALDFLERSTRDLPGFVDWNAPAVRPVYALARTLSHFAAALARLTGSCDPERARVCGLLAPLGWLALAAVAPEAVERGRLDPGCWSVDTPSLARRLARRWDLPGWVGGVIGNLGLPLEVAGRLGADLPLLAVTRQAVRLARDHGLDLGLPGVSLTAEDEGVLGRVDLPGEGGPEEEEPVSWEAPHGQPLLRDLLALAARSRREGTGPCSLAARLEWEVDELHHALEERVAGEEERLRAAKLSSLAEFAAGAGHEINNPLAVISGQAQYLLGHDDWFAGDGGPPRKALEAIIAQTRRIHGLLRDLMQFARPTAPRPTWVDLPTLLGGVASSVGELAAQRKVRLEVSTRRDRLEAFLDGAQVKTILTCLLRNALEAAPAEGWARLVLHEPVGETVSVAVEDSGPGPAAAHREVLFDPFFSGRCAGRGRGLGLPVAWRLARLQGGEVRLDATRPGEPTRFVLTLPYKPSEAGDAPSGGREAA